MKKNKVVPEKNFICRLEVQLSSRLHFLCNGGKNDKTVINGS